MTSKPKLMTNWWSGAQLHEFHRPRGSKLPDGAWLGALGPKIGAPEKTAPPESRSLHKITIAQIATAQIAGQIILGDKLPLSRSKVDALFMALIWGGLPLTKCLRWSQIWGTFERAGNCFWTTTIFEAGLELGFKWYVILILFTKDKTKTSALLWESTPWVELRWNWGVGLLSRMQGQ